MSTFITGVRNPGLVSRHDHLALVASCVVSSAVHAAGEKLLRGTLIGKMGNGKFRAYAEGVVHASGAFATPLKAFKVDMSLSPLAKHFRPGDVIQSVAGVSLGTIDTFDAATGEGMLVANSAAALAAGSKICVVGIALGAAQGRLLTDEIVMAAQDQAAPAFFEGFFVKSLTTVTDAALAAMGGVEIQSDEIRLK